MTRRAVPRLHLIGPLAIEPVDYPGVAVAAVQGGCDAVHVRVPGGATDDMLSMARRIRATIGETALIVNDRLDVAVVCDADGVQLGERGFTVEEARRILPGGMLVGRSVHDIVGAHTAADAGADYLLAGHVFDTPSKARVPGRGLVWLAELAAAVPIPVIALGGITVERISLVLETGAYGVALGRELLLADDPGAVAREAADRMTRDVRSLSPRAERSGVER